MKIQETNQRLSWFSAHGKHFPPTPPGAEYLHEQPDADELTSSETYWFVFSLPQQGIVAQFYTVIRQAFPTCLAGGWIYRGIASDPLLIEHMNYRFSVPRPSFSGSSLSIPQAGLTIDIVEPEKRWKIRYASPDGTASADIEGVARSPVVMAANGEHFDQAIWCKGTLQIGNERFEVDAPGFRDRTWNAPRGEDRLDYPPLDYNWGVLDDGATSFCIRGADDPARGAEWAGKYDLDTGKAFHGGWLFLEGTLHAITKMSKQTPRDFNNKARPLSQRIEFDDDLGRSHVLEGRSVGAMFYQPWGNIGAWMSNMRWSLDETRKGDGEIQELMFSGYAKRFWK